MNSHANKEIGDVDCNGSHVGLYRALHLEGPIMNIPIVGTARVCFDLYVFVFKTSIMMHLVEW